VTEIIVKRGIKKAATVRSSSAALINCSAKYLRCPAIRAMQVKTLHSLFGSLV
jgi:hypothetical protein